MQSELKFLSDEVKLHVGRQTFICRKSNLCERSEYFRAMFSHEFSEKDKNEIVLKDVDETAFNFIFEKKTLDSSVEFDRVMEILKVSCMLQFDKETEEYERYITAVDCISMKPLPVMVLSSILGRTNLYKKAFAYCLWNFSELKSTNDFLNLPFQDVLRYLDDVGLNTKRELEVFEAIKLWSAYNIPKDDSIVSLMKTLRYKSLIIGDLEKICTTPFITKVDYMTKILGSWTEYVYNKVTIGCEDCSSDTTSDGKQGVKCICKINDNLLNTLLELNNKKPRIYSAVPCIVIHRTDTFPTIYDFSGDELRLVLTLSQKPFSKTFVGFRMISVGFKIYLFGGEQGFGYGLFNTGVWSYNLISGACNYECQMLQQRRHFFITTLGDWVFILGGIGKHRKVLDNIEKYNVKTREWFDCTGLNQKSIEAVCSYNKKIYIASRIIYVYDTCENIFDSINIKLPLHGVSFIAIQKNYLYAVDRKDANIYRWKLHSNHCESENLGKFLQNGESILMNNCIYHLSCRESDSTYWVEKFCINTFNIVTKQLTNNIGEFQSKYIGCFQVPNYFLI